MPAIKARVLNTVVEISKSKFPLTLTYSEPEIEQRNLLQR